MSPYFITQKDITSFIILALIAWVWRSEGLEQIKCPSSGICYDVKHGGSIRLRLIYLNVLELGYLKDPALQIKTPAHCMCQIAVCQRMKFLTCQATTE